jgi:hypothetical protein
VEGDSASCGARTERLWLAEITDDRFRSRATKFDRGAVGANQPANVPPLVEQPPYQRPSEEARRARDERDASVVRC